MSIIDRTPLMETIIKAKDFLKAKGLDHVYSVHEKRRPERTEVNPSGAVEIHITMKDGKKGASVGTILLYRYSRTSITYVMNTPIGSPFVNEIEELGKLLSPRAFQPNLIAGPRRKP